MEKTDRRLRRTNALLAVLVVLAVGVTLFVLRGVLIPLAVAVFLSYLAMPVVRFGNRLRVPVSVSLVFVILVLTAIMGGIGIVLYTSGVEFVERLPEWDPNGSGLLEKALSISGLENETIERILGLGTVEREIDWDALLTRLPVVPYAVAGMDTLLTGLSFLFLVLLFTVFIVLDRGHGALERRIVDAFAGEGSKHAQLAMDHINREIEQYIITKTGIGLLTGTCACIALWILGVPYVLLFGVIIFFLNYIPNIGSIIATIPPVLVAMATFESPYKAIPVLVVLGTLQFFIGNVLEPLILGRRMRINPMVVVLALVVWGWLWGIWGMVLAIPLTAVIRIILDHAKTGRSVATLMRYE